MNIDNELFQVYLNVITTGIASGFVIGFISWAIGFGIYGIINWFKLS